MAEVSNMDQPLTKADAAVLLRKMDQILQKLSQVESKGEKAYYRCGEFAALTGLPESTVRYHCNTGEINAIKKGKSWLIPAEELLKSKHNNT